MKYLNTCKAVLVALSVVSAAAVAGTDSADALFNHAAEAYDKGEYTEAAQIYQDLISNGHESLEVFYNGANAAFREGKIGRAVLLYRQAWYISPRDADVQANLQLALQRTGAIQAKRSIVDLFFQEFSHREWVTLFNIAYWIAIVLIALVIFVPNARRFIKPAAITAGTVALLGCAGWFYWYQWQQSGEAVVLKNQTALYEPREAATKFFALPEGSLVTIDETFDNWVKVRISKDSGWIPRAAAARVFPWKTAPIE